MINLSAEDVAENLDAVLNLLKNMPVRIIDETGQVAILISFDTYKKLKDVESRLMRIKDEAASETKPDVEGLHSI